MSTTPKYLSVEERRAMAVKSVLALAAVQNPADITTAAIAAHMGLSQAGVFRHFSTKDEIWKAVMEWVATELYSRVSGAAENATGPLAALEAMFRTHIDFILEYPGVPRIVFGELQKPEQTSAKIAAQVLFEKYGALLTIKLEQAKASGEVDPTIPVPTAVVLFVGAIQSLTIDALLCGKIEHLRPAAPEAFALFRRAIRSLE